MVTSERKMRLIDADDLIPQMESDASEIEDPIASMFAYAAINDIKHAPTVEAIPVSWIKERMSNIEDTMLEMAWSMLISDWEERETE